MSMDLHKFYDSIKLMADFCGGNMPWHQGQIFLLVAVHDQDGGIDMKDIGQKVGIASSSASRNVAALGEWHRLQKPGLGLVETLTNYRDRRRKPVVLTKKGRNLIGEISRRLANIDS